MSLSAVARLLRGFAVDFLTAHDTSVVERIMDPAYRLSIGGHLFDGRDESYLPATAAQLDQFPGLCVTVHDVVIAPDACAMRFTEHGVSAREGRASSWGGITLFRVRDGRLAHGWAEEDYFARKRQLKNGVVDTIGRPHPAPWDEPEQGPDAGVETVVRALLADPARLLDGLEELSAEGPRLASLIAPAGIEVSTCFSAGNRAAFHAVLTGAYAGGFDDVDADRVAGDIRLPVAGIVDTRGGRIARVQLCGDRLGLHRRLLAQGRA